MSDTIQQICKLLHDDPDLTPEVADALSELITVAYNQFGSGPERLNRPKFTGEDFTAEADDAVE